MPPARLAIGALASLLGLGAAHAADSARLTPADVIFARSAVSPPTTPSSTPVASKAAVPAQPAPVAANPAHEAPSPTIQDLVAKHAHDNGVPVGLAEAVIRIESRFNPRASNRGALGLMQIKAGTARNVGFSGSAAGLLTPDTNLRYGMKVLAEAYRASNGDVCRTLAYYQSGRPVHRFNAAQRSYCTRARAFMAHA